MHSIASTLYVLLVGIMLLGLTGCAELRHELQRLPDDRVQYRLSVRSSVSLNGSALDQFDAFVQGLSDLGTVRWWRDDEVWILHASFPDAASYGAFSERAGEWVAGVAELRPMRGRVLPPDLQPADSGWEVRAMPGVAGPGWTLVLGSPQVGGEPDRRLADRGFWFVEPEESRQVTAILSSDPSPGLGDFLLRGGPALACALAGLGVLMWVNRRTRRRLARSAT